MSKQFGFSRHFDEGVWRFMMWPEVGIVAMCNGMEKTHAIPAETAGPLITWLQEPPAVLVSEIRAGLRQSVAPSVCQAWGHVALGTWRKSFSPSTGNGTICGTPPTRTAMSSCCQQSRGLGWTPSSAVNSCTVLRPSPLPTPSCRCSGHDAVCASATWYITPLG
jgi:hypothetical protein